jgi:hypothetical protein
VAAVLLAGVGVVGTGAGASAAGAAARPESYGGDAVAATVEYRVDRQPEPFPVNDPFHIWVPYAGTSIDSSGGAEGIASSVYPGGFLGVPAAICVLAGALCSKLPGGGPPDYPDWAHAQYPAHPDVSAQLSQHAFPGTGPFEVTPNEVAAHADPNRVEATTGTAGSGLSNVLSVQSSTAHSLQMFKGSTLVMTAESVLKGIDIGGTLHIDEMRSTATGAIDGSHPATGSAVTTVSGATIAGHAVTIDSSGIHADGHGDNGQVQQQVNKALANLASHGIDVRSLGTQRLVETRKVQTASNGLLLTFRVPIKLPTQVPVVGSSLDGDYFGTLTIGGAGVSAFASPAVPFGIGTVQVPTTAVTGGTGPSTSTGGKATLPGPAAQAAIAPTGGQQPAVAAAGAAKAVALPSDLTNKRLKTLALVLLAYPLLVLLTAPLRGPSRLPRAR